MRNANVVSDQAKEAYAHGTQMLAELAYQLAAVTGVGKIDDETCMGLQTRIAHIYHWLYIGTLYAVRDSDQPEECWDDNESTYSDGSPVRVQLQPVPEDYAWPHNCHLLEDGHIIEYPLGAVSVINDSPARKEGRES
jgi:hypothetical protein